MKAQSSDLIPRKPLRLWPGVSAAVLLVLIKFVAPLVMSDAGVIAILGGLACAFAIIVWWLLFSRAPWTERLGAILVMIGGLFLTSRVVHESISNGMMGMWLPLAATPMLSLVLVAWAAAARGLSGGARRVTMVVAILVACGAFTLLRTGGISGDADSDLHWRWTPTPEERLLARGEEQPLDSARDKPLDSTRDTAPAIASGPVVAGPPEKQALRAPSEPPASARPPAAVDTSAPKAAAADSTSPSGTAWNADSEAQWPGFRGPERDSVLHGVRIETDWSKKPPVELWRKPIGPGWSSFAVHGDLVYTQEQRGDDEDVSAYNLNTGQLVWRHRDAARFWESNAGAGPRATPTFSNGRVYTFGATGIVNALDARDGSVVWTRNAASDTGAELPGWGFASSPLVVNDAVIVAASGRLVAYDAETGKPRWVRQTQGGSYSSPQRATIGGVTQILLLSGGGATGVAPIDGTVLWEYRWPEAGINIVQPAMTADGDVLIGAIDAAAVGLGTRRVGVKHGPGGWTVDERWRSTALKPSFNDYVLHEGHAFGFDGSILACIDLADGTRKWKGGRYGHGQLVLLPDQDLLLVLSEDGELALVRATPDEFTEIARVPAIEGKTWNHPVLAGDVLLVRNGEEMAAFRLLLVGG